MCDKKERYPDLVKELKGESESSSILRQLDTTLSRLTTRPNSSKGAMR